MAPTILDYPALGEGIYTFSEAARIIAGASDHKVTTRQLRYWVDEGIVPPSHQPEDEEPILTFDDLISLEVIRRFRHIGTSLQKVRYFESRLADHLSLRRPFAYKKFFTDGASVWAEEVGADAIEVVEIAGQRLNNYAWTDAIKTFARDISFDESLHAVGWALSTWVHIDPAIQFGAPVIRGTRVPLSSIKSGLAVASVEQVADWYGLKVAQVRGARDFIALS